MFRNNSIILTNLKLEERKKKVQLHVESDSKTRLIKAIGNNSINDKVTLRFSIQSVMPEIHVNEDCSRTTWNKTRVYRRLYVATELRAFCSDTGCHIMDRRTQRANKHLVAL